MAAIPQTETTIPATRLELNLEGMHCGGYASRLRSALKQQAGIREATIDHKTSRGRIEYHPDRATERQIRATIDRLGFAVGSE